MFKKRNDEPTEPQTPELLIPRALPPFRTWVVRSPEWSRLEDGSYPSKAYTTYEAHTIDINANGFIVFQVYFRHPDADQIMQVPRYFLHSSEWVAIEEVNAMFAEPIKH